MQKTDNQFRKAALLGCASLLAILAAQQGAQAQEATPVPPVTVTAPTEQPLDGSVAAGYRVGDSTASGPIWGDLPVQDAPYSFTVVPSALIDNLQAWDMEQIVQVIPQITNATPLQNNNGNIAVWVRGFEISQFLNEAGMTYDGLQGGVGGELATTLEDKERVEILSGVNGFLYGIGSVGGNINYVLKRPTATPLYSLTLGDNAGDNFYVHADLGGPLKFAGIADGLFGYRLNLVYQDGDTSLDHQSIKRDLESGAIDIHLPYGALLQFNAAHSDYHVYGLTSYSVVSTLNPLPAPPNGTYGAGPSWSQFLDITDTVGAKLTWKANDIFTLRSQWGYTRENRPISEDYVQQIANYAGDLKGRATNSGTDYITYTHSGYTFLDTSFSTFGIQHKVTTGFTGYVQDAGTGGNGTATFSTSYSVGSLGTVYDPIEPAAAAGGAVNDTPFKLNRHTFAENWVAGDEIKITDKLTFLIGGNYASVGQESPSTGMGFTDSKLTPSASILYKVLPWFTTYATYQQSLQSGELVQNSGSAIYTNNGAVLPPYVGNQYEVGAKATVAKNMLLTIAFFDIDKANQYTVENPNGTYTAEQSGTEVHKGVELTGTGKLTDDLTLIGGITAMDARVVSDLSTPAGDGSVPQYVSPYSGKLYAEYTIPYLATASFLHNLTLIGGFQYASWSYTNYPNTRKAPGYAIGNLGFRYATDLYAHPFILRFNVNNVTDHAYWAGGNAYLGAPRTFLASAQMKW